MEKMLHFFLEGSKALSFYVQKDERNIRNPRPYSFAKRVGRMAREEWPF